MVVRQRQTHRAPRARTVAASNCARARHTVLILRRILPTARVHSTHAHATTLYLPTSLAHLAVYMRTSIRIAIPTEGWTTASIHCARHLRVRHGVDNDVANNTATTTCTRGDECTHHTMYTQLVSCGWPTRCPHRSVHADGAARSIHRNQHIVMRAICAHTRNQCERQLVFYQLVATPTATQQVPTHAVGVPTTLRERSHHRSRMLAPRRCTTPKA